MSDDFAAPVRRTQKANSNVTGILHQAYGAKVAECRVVSLVQNG